MMEELKAQAARYFKCFRDKELRHLAKAEAAKLNEMGELAKTIGITSEKIHEIIESQMEVKPIEDIIEKAIKKAGKIQL